MQPNTQHIILYFQQFECCGFVQPSDYRYTQWISDQQPNINVPLSCCQLINERVSYQFSKIFFFLKPFYFIHYHSILYKLLELNVIFQSMTRWKNPHPIDLYDCQRESGETRFKQVQFWVEIVEFLKTKLFEFRDAFKVF